MKLLTVLRRRATSRAAVPAVAVLACVTALNLTAPAAGYAGGPHAAVADTGAPAGITTAVVPPGPPGPPQGQLAQTGCTLSGTSASCDLFAKPGTIVLPGLTAALPIWGFASTATAAATLPGPVLVVDQGDTVTITIHNGLSNALALALPAVTGFAPDTVGAGPGSAKAYSFTATRPGTYLYEAGHTADGARQVAMGLAGALVVRAPLVGTSASAYGDAASVYDDEAMVVLSEVDPAFNAAPTTFDLRSFAAKYRLINGKAFPETDTIATDVSRKVLLRYVDIGLQPHPMTVLGVDQFVVGQDARPVSYPEGGVTLPIQPGQAVDALVAMPAGPDGRRFALYESGGMLNNNGQRAGTAATASQAFGGMLTFLDTNPPVVSGDHVGPVASAVSSVPEPASVLNPVTVNATFTDVPNGNSAVDAAELVIDDLSVAEGSGTAFTGTFGTPTVTVSATIAPAVLGTLTQGRHAIWVRGHDAAGNWGVVGSTIMTLSSTGPATTSVALTSTPTTGAAAVTITATGDDSGLGGTVNAGEYFIDTPGANTTGTVMTVPVPNVTTAAETGSIPAVVMAALPEGRHTISVHSRDSFGLWGPFGTGDLIVDRTLPTLVSSAVLPPATNGTVGSPADPTDIRINAAFTDPVGGGVNSEIAGAEGFIDTPGASGSGFTFLALDGSFNSPTENTYSLVPLTETVALVNGTHQLLIHAKDAAGNWGPLSAASFVVDRQAPVVSAVAVSPNPTNGAATVALAATAVDALSGIAAAEWYDGADPGIGFGHPMTVAAATLSASLPTAGFTLGVHRLSVRARDNAGNWSLPGSVNLTVGAADAIFADAFTSNSTTAWSQTVGTPSAASGALVATGIGYVVDNTPTAEAAFHARFDVAVGTFNARTGIVDIFQGRGTAGAAVTVQLRRNGTATQIRLGLLTGPAPGTWGYSAWVNTTGGTVRLAWASGVSAAATLSVNGSTTGTRSGDTSGYRIESAALGLVAQSNATSTGSLTVDNYASTRTSAL